MKARSCRNFTFLLTIFLKNKGFMFLSVLSAIQIFLRYLEKSREFPQAYLGDFT